MENGMTDDNNSLHAAAGICAPVKDEEPMKPETKHTPTPWSYRKNSTFYDISGSGGFGHIADTCASSATVPFNGRSIELGEANAEFIVRACNAHDALVEAVYAACRMISVKYTGKEQRENEDWSIIEAALALAKGGV